MIFLFIEAKVKLFGRKDPKVSNVGEIFLIYSPLKKGNLCKYFWFMTHWYKMVSKYFCRSFLRGTILLYIHHHYFITIICKTRCVSGGFVMQNKIGLPWLCDIGNINILDVTISVKVTTNTSWFQQQLCL